MTYIKSRVEKRTWDPPSDGNESKARRDLRLQAGSTYHLSAQVVQEELTSRELPQELTW